MAAGDSIVTIQEITDYLDVSGAAEDAKLEALERRVRAFIEGATGRWFGAEKTFVEVLDGPRPDTAQPDDFSPFRGFRPSGAGDLDLVVHLQERPTADTLKVETRLALDDAWELLADLAADPQVGATKIETDGRAVWRRDGLAWPRGPRRIRATYVAGFTADGSQPGDVKQAALDLIALKWRQREIAGFSDFRSGNLRVNKSDAQEIGFWDTLRRFKNVEAMIA